MEVFVQSIHYPMYMLSSEGRVFSRKRWRFLKNVRASRNFIQVSMDGKNVTLHRELAESFACAPLVRVWFKNNDKTDCRLENLDWALEEARPQKLTKPVLYVFEDNKFKLL